MRIEKKQIDIDRLVDKGLYYSRSTLNNGESKMPDHRDRECRKPSRIYLTKLFMEKGADPNIMAKEVNMTPIHWLCFWGDYRSINLLINLNSIHRITIEKGFWSCLTNEKDERDKHIRKHGTFNAFFSANKQTPIDIAGDLQN